MLQLVLVPVHGLVLRTPQVRNSRMARLRYSDTTWKPEANTAVNFTAAIRPKPWSRCNCAVPLLLSVGSGTLGTRKRGTGPLGLGHRRQGHTAEKVFASRPIKVTSNS
ncbi:hypothetical protein J6590_070893 [Homalodisca vitripennis]|nr:hypothetical protein J6590_070893 [Homalodisca vitripennis]